MRLGMAPAKKLTMPSGTVRSILSNKGADIFAASPSNTVFEAIEMMNAKRVGALLVMDESKLVGIISERDYARKVILMGRSSKDTRVEEIMSSPVIVVDPDTPLEECMRIVTERRIRHLPVVENHLVVGVVSIGDLVRSIITEQAETIDQLHNYIHGSYPA
jgi:CBS domain-containing protein